MREGTVCGFKSHVPLSSSYHILSGSLSLNPNSALSHDSFRNLENLARIVNSCDMKGKVKNGLFRGISMKCISGCTTEWLVFSEEKIGNLRDFFFFLVN